MGMPIIDKNELIRMRHRAALTQKELAAEIGVHLNTVHNVEKGRNDISFTNFLKWVWACGYKVEAHRVYKSEASCR